MANQKFTIILVGGGTSRKGFSSLMIVTDTHSYRSTLKHTNDTDCPILLKWSMYI